MKYSYPLIRKCIPGLKRKAELIEALTMHAFEAGDGPGGSFEASVPPNRYSDAASHWGLAREVAAILGSRLRLPAVRPPRAAAANTMPVAIMAPGLCQRMAVWRFDRVKIDPSPKWLQRALLDCGMRPISNVVDITNYVTLETGQPLHAFDFDRMAGGKLIVRRARRGERLELLDGAVLTLDPSAVVLADARSALDLGGIKGGRKAEISEGTKRILLTAGNFDGPAIYRTSRRFNVATDASVRFSHGLSEALPPLGLDRAAELLVKLTGARALGRFDSRMKPFPRHILEFDVAWFARFIGTAVSRSRAAQYLKRLGFTNVERNLWDVPPLRPDIESREDLAEEVARLMGYDQLKARPPRFHLVPAIQDDAITFREKARQLLVTLGFDEIYTHSFVSREKVRVLGAAAGAVELENPVSEEFRYLRPSLVSGLLESVELNAKVFEELKLFEVGRMFWKPKAKVIESTALGIVAASRAGEPYANLKGAVEVLLRGLGVADYHFAPPSQQRRNGLALQLSRRLLDTKATLSLEVDGKVVGYIGKSSRAPKGWNVSLAEVDLGALLHAAEGEAEFRPLPKFPSVMRDLSLFVGPEVRIGDLMQAMQQSNPRLIGDVDLIDEYGLDPERRSLTFRVIFQAPDRTLTGDEVDREVVKITSTLEKRFRARVR